MIDHGFRHMTIYPAYSLQAVFPKGAMVGNMHALKIQSFVQSEVLASALPRSYLILKGKMVIN